MSKESLQQTIMNQKTKSKKPRNKKKTKEQKKTKSGKNLKKISFFSDMQKKSENFRISKKNLKNSENT